MNDDAGGVSAWLSALDCGQVSVRAVTDGNPFCAGILVVRHGRLLCALGSHGDAVLRGGAEVISTPEANVSAQLWLPPNESLTTVAPLLTRHPELEKLLSR